MSLEAYTSTMKSTLKFFERSVEVLEEQDSNYAPTKGVYTVAQQIAHTAQAVDWFLEGAFAESGMNDDFAAMNEEIIACRSLKKANDWMRTSMTAMVEKLESSTMDDWMQPIAEGIMGGQPRLAIIEGIVDHCAHHRGSLTVYARMLGKEPAMPYA